MIVTHSQLLEGKLQLFCYGVPRVGFLIISNGFQLLVVDSHVISFVENLSSTLVNDNKYIVHGLYQHLGLLN